MKRIRTSAPRIRRERRWPEDLPDDPRDPDVVRAKALALVIDAELTRLGAVARWLDLADEHVSHAAAEPAPARGAKLRRRVVVRR